MKPLRILCASRAPLLLLMLLITSESGAQGQSLAKTAQAPPTADRAQIDTSIPPSDGKASVLFFVQGSTCPHCMTQLTEMIRGLGEKDLEVAIVSASTEADLEQFPKMPFRLVTHPQLTLFKKFDVFDGGPKHATIVRDRSGQELLRKVGDEPFLEVDTILASLQTSGPKLVIAVRGTDSPDDDYVTWAPTRCEIRIIHGTVGGPDVPIEISNEAAASPEVGTLLFEKSVDGHHTATQSLISLNVKQDGSPTEFFIAGKTPSRLTNASLANQGRDAVIVARATNGTISEVARRPVMVRVRMNASTLNPLERSEYLDAVATLKAGGRYQEMVTLHTIATGRTAGANWPDQAHGDSGFLPWHRAFLARYERELQKSHPHVALHYWREVAIPMVFRQDFLGANVVQPGSPIVRVDFGDITEGNPLHGWSIGGTALGRRAVARHRKATDEGARAVRRQSVRQVAAIERCRDCANQEKMRRVKCQQICNVDAAGHLHPWPLSD